MILSEKCKIIRCENQRSYKSSLLCGFHLKIIENQIKGDVK